MEAVTTDKTKRFSRSFRLLRPEEFSHVFDKARRSRDQYYTVLYRPNNQDTARVGFAIAKKRISAAVDRNRVRRLARESFRHFRASLPAMDIIILAQSAAVKTTNAELFTSLEKHWQALSAKPTKRSPNKDNKN